MADMSLPNETELESLCLRFLQEAGRVPPDSAAFGRALTPLVPVIKDWVRARLRRLGDIPAGARGRIDLEDVFSTVFCRLYAAPPTDLGLTPGKSIARLHHWLNKVVYHLRCDLLRAASDRERTCGDHDFIQTAHADEESQPERLLAPDAPPCDLDWLVAVIPADLLNPKQLALLRLDILNTQTDPMRTDAAHADELGVSLDNVYQLRRRYLLKLREWWEKNREFYP